MEQQEREVKTEEETSVLEHLQNSSYTFNLAAMAIETSLEVNVCKIAKVVNAALVSAQSEFCATSNYKLELEVDPVETVAGFIQSEHNVAHCLSDFIDSLLYGNTATLCEVLSVVISVLNSLQASDVCKPK